MLLKRAQKDMNLNAGEVISKLNHFFLCLNIPIYKVGIITPT